MKILLTGSRGFVGTKLLDSLSTHEVTAFDFCDPSKPTLEDYEQALTSVAGDKDFDVILHVGAIPTPQSTDVSLLHWNTVCSEFLFDRYADSKIIFISSNMAVDPINLYGWSKQLAERTLSLISSNYCILRPSAIFGEPFDRKSSLPIVDLVAAGRVERLYRDYERYFIHIDDVVKAIKKAVDMDLSGLFHLRTDKSYGAVELAAAFGIKDVSIVETPDITPKVLRTPPPLFPFDWELLDPMQYLEDKRNL